MKKTVFPVLLIALAFALILSSCDDFFGTSWGSAREYDKSNVKVNAGNAMDWVERAIGDPGLADVVSDAIIDQLARGNLSQGDKNTLSNAGMELAVESSGLGESVLKNATGSLTDLLEETDDTDATEKKLKDILGKIQSDFRAANGAKAADNIAKIAALNLANNSTKPEFDDGYKTSVSPGVLGESVIVLVMGVLGDRSVDSFVDGDEDKWNDIAVIAEGLAFDDKDYVIIEEGKNPSDTAKALAACFNLITGDSGTKFKDDPITGAIRDAFLNK